MDLLKRLDASDVHGDLVRLRRTDPRHLNEEGRVEAPPAEEEGFGKRLAKGLEQTSMLQNASEKLMTAFIVDPDSVEAHDVTIAMEKARMALSLTKTVIDRGIKAYREIIALR